MNTTPGEITQLLGNWRGGDPSALNQIMTLVYDDLREIARAQLRGDHPATLPSRALVHELYLKLARGVEVDFRNRGHFTALAARMLRNIAVDYYRAQVAEKRGGGALRAEDADNLAMMPGRVDLLALDDCLNRLAEIDPRSAELVELRFFGGLTNAEIAESLGTSEATVKRDWAIAKTWLLAQMNPATAPVNAAVEDKS